MQVVYSLAFSGRFRVIQLFIPTVEMWQNEGIEVVFTIYAD